MNPLGTGPEKCALCGMVAVGYARINNDRYCHGDDQEMSCYEQASVAEGRAAIAAGDYVGLDEIRALRDRLRRQVDL